MRFIRAEAFWGVETGDAASSHGTARGVTRVYIYTLARSMSHVSGSLECPLKHKPIRSASLDPWLLDECEGIGLPSTVEPIAGCNSKPT